MTQERSGTAGRAADLRRAFDQSFAESPLEAAADPLNLLALRAGGEPYAVRLDEISGLVPSRTTVDLPSAIPGFLGVARLRHELVPVYRLRSLLGSATSGEAPRWLIIARVVPPVAFAFEQFEGHRRVPPSALLPSGSDALTNHARATVRLDDGLRAVLSIGALIETIEHHLRLAGPTKEQ